MMEIRNVLLNSKLKEGYDIMAKNFETSLGELEEIVKKLEKGDATLDESLKLFENGIKLAKNCQNMLDTAEKKVSVVMADENGDMKKQDFLTNEE